MKLQIERVLKFLQPSQGPGQEPIQAPQRPHLDSTHKPGALAASSNGAWCTKRQGVKCYQILDFFILSFWGLVFPHPKCSQKHKTQTNLKMEVLKYQRLQNSENWIITMKINQFNSFFNVYLAKETVRNAKQNRITFIIIIIFF